MTERAADPTRVTVPAPVGDVRGDLPGQARSRPPPQTTGWPLVGRRDELAQLAAARAGGCPAVVLAGPVGVGKSRLMSEALSAARVTDGAVVVRVRATRSAASVPLGAFAHAVPADARSDDMFVLLQRSARALHAQAAGRPLVLGVDDAQLLDPVSAALVLHLASAGVAFVLSTVRVPEPCPDAISSLWKDTGGLRLELGPLDATDTASLAEVILGGPLERAGQRWLVGTSRGNALYVRELIRAARAAGALEWVNGLWRRHPQQVVGQTLTELVSSGLTGLTDRQLAVLQLLALGEPLQLGELLELVGHESLTVTEARGLIEVQGFADDALVRLADPLYGEVIRTRLPTLRAHQVRLQLARALQSRAQPAAPQDTLQLARLLIDAGAPLPADLLLHAGRAANASGDPTFGADLASRATAAGAGVEATLLLARAHTLQHHFEQAAAVLAGAETQLCTPEQAIGYLEQQSEVLHWGLKQPAVLSQLLDRASHWWPDQDWSARLEPFRERITTFERLGTPAPTTSDPPRLLDGPTPSTRGHIRPSDLADLFYSGNTADALQLARRLRPDPPLRDLDAAIALALWSRITLETGQAWGDLDTWMTWALEQGVRLGDTATAGQAAYSLAGLRLAAGRYTDTTALLAEAERQLERHDPVGLLVVVTAMHVTAACFTRDRDATTSALRRLDARLASSDPLPHQLPYTTRAQAWAEHASGDHAGAQRRLLDLAAQMSASPVHAARLTYEAMRAGADPRHLAASLNTLRQRCDAQLVAAYAQHAAARAARDGPALVKVSDRMQQIGALRYAAEAAAHAADAYAHAGRDDSARRAAARSRTLTPPNQGALPPAITHLDTTTLALTAREAQLVELAAQGLSNSQIATRLVLSVRTVESHLYRAMHKLGVNKRSQI